MCFINPIVCTNASNYFLFAAELNGSKPLPTESTSAEVSTSDESTKPSKKVIAFSSVKVDKDSSKISSDVPDHQNREKVKLPNNVRRNSSETVDESSSEHVSSTSVPYGKPGVQKQLDGTSNDNLNSLVPLSAKPNKEQIQVPANFPMRVLLFFSF